MNILKVSFFLPLAALLFGTKANAQQVYILQEDINWRMVQPAPGETSKPYITFDKAMLQNVASPTPYYTEIIKHGFDAAVTADLLTWETADMTPEELATINPAEVPYKFTPNISYLTFERKPAAKITFIPLLKDAFGKVKKITSFAINITATPTLGGTLQGSYNWAENSVLEKGKWAKVTIAIEGVYKLNVSQLSDAGLPASGADISTIRLYGNGGAMLPQANLADKNDDLVENPIEIRDLNQNGKFDGNDFLVFYAEGPNVWELETASLRYKMNANKYADRNYYYVTIGAPGGKRITDQAEDAGPHTNTTTEFDEFFHHEKDLINLLKSGREWLGEEFDRVTTYEIPVDLTDVVTSEQVKIRSQVIGRSQEPMRFDTYCNNQLVISQNIKGITFNYDWDYTAAPDTVLGSFPVSTNKLNIRYTYNKPTTSSKGWLNFFDLVYRRKMLFNGGAQVIFRDSKNLGGANITEFAFDDNGQNISIWEVTSPLEAVRQANRKNGQIHNFILKTNTLRTFVAFDDATLKSPEEIQAVENQNLHGLRDIEFVIIAHPDFLTEAKRLAEHHTDYDGLTTAVVTPQQIYNEFSSGKQDVSAIRNFMKMLYDRPNATKTLKYLLLFGDASYDFKDRLAKNTNFVPTYQSRNIHSPVFSTCGDDYYGLLDDNEGAWSENGSLTELIDIGIGRIPVQTAGEAKQMVDKIIAYTNQNKKAFGDWRNNVCFLADDEDNNSHLEDGEIFSSIVESKYRNYNVDKLYIDAYKQQSVGSGTRYPEVNDLLNRKVDRGLLIINYNGHGGEQGLAVEQILDVPMVNSWKNINNMPLFVTATCEFSRYDDPGRVSAGEQVLLNPNGGGIALMTTVRLVYQGDNRLLNTAIYDNNIFSLHNGEVPRLGDVFKRAKNAALNLNNRNFSLLGDPALTLAYPEQTVVTTEINGNGVGTSSDTASALQKVTIKGEVRDHSGNKLSNFNGIIFPTVFDKLTKITTLANDPSSDKVDFTMYKNIIYKGKASVKDGDFEFSFIVPKDISYSLGSSKISYYATNYVTDAHGYYDSLVVTGSDNAAQKDITGPTIRLFMNDTTFRFGGQTDENPTLLALVSDLHGINTTGNGIGRDITAILDGDRKEVIILNDYYQATLDSYQSGEIRYPLKNLSEGLHNIKVKVWDVYNNSAEGYTEFIVANSDKLAIKRLMNYPNPFSEKTTFYFEHNKQGKEMTVDIDVYTMSGQLIKTFTTHIPEAGANFDGLEWNPSDDFGNNISQGLYLFRVKVRCGNDTVEQTEKMVLIK